MGEHLWHGPLGSSPQPYRLRLTGAREKETRSRRPEICGPMAAGWPKAVLSEADLADARAGRYDISPTAQARNSSIARVGEGRSRPRFCAGERKTLGCPSRHPSPPPATSAASSWAACAISSGSRPRRDRRVFRGRIVPHNLSNARFEGRFKTRNRVVNSKPPENLSGHIQFRRDDAPIFRGSDRIDRARARIPVHGGDDDHGR